MAFTGPTSGWLSAEDQNVSAEDIEEHLGDIENRVNYVLPRTTHEAGTLAATGG